MWSRFVLILIFIGSLYTLADELGDSNERSGGNTCIALETCASCIQNSKCAWCSKSDYHGQDKKPLPRCNTLEGHAQNGGFQCPRNQLFSPVNLMTVERNESLTASSSSSKGKTSKAVPVQPQKLSLKMRVGEPINFQIRYKEVEDYPLDLYYLMDGTYTMKDDKEVLYQVGDEIGERLRRLTTKFRQGFGTFVDKVTMPFVLTVASSFDNPCAVRNDTCVPPYGFKNHMKLSNNTRQFSEAVRNFVLSGSSDIPEGGFDALMQVMVCNKEIDWSEQARRLIIFATDAPFHYAGDGWLGGVILPNDGLCHMDERGEFYTHSLIQDYPSIAQINAKAKEHSFNIIFAVTSEYIEEYKLLQEVIEGSKSTELAKNSSNIVNLVEEEYKRIKSKVEIKDTFPTDYFKVRYFTRCLNSSNDETQQNICEGLKPETLIEFRVEIELIKCPPRKAEWQQQYRIYAVGVLDGIDLDVEALCDCPCEDPRNWIRNSPICNFQGSEACGLCECNTNFFGKYCECTGRSNRKDELNACKMDNSSEPCSGRGTCVCGQCQCSNPSRYSGPFCECDNSNCLITNEQQCAGHGECDCGQCRCESGWEGQGCECPTNKATCFAVGDDEECSGQGECVCGQCQCIHRYSGEYCEKCLHESCPTKCEEFKHCVQCKTHGTGIYNPSDCELHCYQQSITVVDVISVAPGSEEVLCRAEDPSDECTFIFSYITAKDKTYRIDSQRTKECPPKAPIVWIVTILSSLIVLIGIIALCAYKFYSDYQVKREYARYENERSNVVFGQETNPIYNNPVTTFQNPQYVGSKN